MPKHKRNLDVTVVINAPEWYERPDFVKWLNDDCCLTWHDGGKPHDYSDAFVIIDHGNSQDEPQGDGFGLPQDIWDWLLEEVGDRYTGIVWIQNID